MTYYYKGNKNKLLHFIQTSLDKYGCQNISTVADLCSGTGIVSWMFANKRGVEYVWSNDTEVYAYIMSIARLTNEHEDDLVKRLSILSNSVKPYSGFITKHYATKKTPYFLPDEAKQIDGIRKIISKNDVHALASLFQWVMKNSNSYGKLNTPGSYERLLKQRTQLNGRITPKSMTLFPVRPYGYPSTCECYVTRLDITHPDFIFDRCYDLVYLDPPYTAESRYVEEYHILNTIALNDEPDVRGKHNMRNDVVTSKFTLVSKAMQTYTQVFKVANCRYICVSYKQGGILSKDQMIKAMAVAGIYDVKVFQKKSKSVFMSAGNRNQIVTELLFIGKKAN